MKMQITNLTEHNFDFNGIELKPKGTIKIVVDDSNKDNIANGIKTGLFKGIEFKPKGKGKGKGKEAKDDEVEAKYEVEPKEAKDE